MGRVKKGRSEPKKGRWVESKMGGQPQKGEVDRAQKREVGRAPKGQVARVLSLDMAAASESGHF